MLARYAAVSPASGPLGWPLFRRCTALSAARSSHLAQTGASAIKCCYAAAGSGTGAEETGSRTDTLDSESDDPIESSSSMLETVVGPTVPYDGHAGLRHLRFFTSARS